MQSKTPGEAVRAEVARLGGGAYLGTGRGGGWVLADPESAVMVLGPPRCGKTSAVMIPAVMGASGAVVATSTKPEVMRATVAARSEVGQAWLFDPCGLRAAAARGGAAAVLVAGRGGQHVGRGAGDGEGDDGVCSRRRRHHATRATGPSAPPRCWHRSSTPPTSPTARSPRCCAGRCARTSPRHGRCCSTATREIAADVLAGIEQTDARERSSIFSATAGVLAAYNADAVRATRRPAQLRSDPLRGVDRHDLHHRARAQAGALRAADRRPAGADPPCGL